MPRARASAQARLVRRPSLPESVRCPIPCSSAGTLTQHEGAPMTRVLLVGYDPETVDFSDPALPPGMTAEKIHAGIAVALKQFAERGWEGHVGFIRPDETAGPTVERQLASAS